MDRVISFTPATLWQGLLALCAAITVVAVATGHIIKAVNAAKAPGQKTQERLRILEERVQQHDDFFKNDKERLDTFEEGNRITQRAILALLSHGIYCNDIEGMRKAKD